MVWSVVGSSALGWYLSFKRVTHYNALAWAEFEVGIRTSEPVDGAASAFVALAGWLPWLLFCLAVLACTMVARRLWCLANR